MTPVRKFRSLCVVKLTPREMLSLTTSCQYAVIDASKDQALRLSNLVATFFTEKGAVTYCESH